MLTFEEFKKEILNWATNEKPKNWRFGQAVFNYVDIQYGVARMVQFQDHVDCFYSNDAVDLFIEKAYEHYLELNSHE